jgi:hypothetical protein
VKVNASLLSDLAAFGPFEVAAIARAFPIPEVDELVRVLTSFTGSIGALP